MSEILQDSLYLLATLGGFILSAWGGSYLWLVRAYGRKTGLRGAWRCAYRTVMNRNPIHRWRLIRVNPAYLEWYDKADGRMDTFGRHTRCADCGLEADHTNLPPRSAIDRLADVVR